ncbi:MAG: PAS domain-containing sensor histidine kinase [bacterium]|nr:PAS domain-containing sensor histidine kinase [bacterium]
MSLSLPARQLVSGSSPATGPGSPPAAPLEVAPRGALLRAIVAGGRDVLLTVSSDGWIERASDAAPAVFGRTEGELAGMALDHVVRPADDGGAEHADLVRPDGRRVRCALAAWPAAEAGRWMVLVRDVAEAQAAEAALREEGEVARALLDLGDTLNRHLGDPYVLDWVTTIALRLLGCDWSTVLGWDARRRRYRPFATAGVLPGDPGALVLAPEELGLLDLLEPGGVVELADLARQDLLPAAPLLELGLTTALCVPICQRRDVVGLLIHAWKQPPAPSPRTHRLAVGIAQATAFALDNTLRLSELQSANRMKSEFLSTLSHELRTPLNVLLGYSEMLADADAADRALVGGIARATVQLRDVVEGAQDLSWLDAGVVLEPEEIDLPALAAELVAAVDPLRTADTALLTEGVPPGRVVLDRRALYTTLKHLLTNACKFTPRGWVSLGVEMGDEVATFTVQDTGVGMAADDVPACFERLRQIDGSNTRRFGGLGIGLYVVRRLVETQGGTVAVDTAPGAGTTVSVSLPLAG